MSGADQNVVSEEPGHRLASLADGEGCFYIVRQRSRARKLVRYACGFAAFVDGLTFCLTQEKQLALHAWTCAESGCTERYRFPVSDYSTLGRAMWLGSKEESERPHCRAHKKKGER